MRDKRKGARGGDPKVKGVAFRSVLVVAEEILGREAIERAVASLGEEEREMLRYKVVHTGWYPIALYRSLWRALLETSGRGEALVREIGASSIRRDVTGVYRMLFKVFSPETVFSIVTKLFSNYYDTGHVEVEGERGSARIVYEGCEGFDRTMWVELLGSGEELLRLAGAREPELTIVRGGVGASCEVEARWA